MDQIIQNMRMQESNIKIIPATSSKLLSKHLESDPFKKSFKYQIIVRKYNYLDWLSQSDIGYSIHQCAWLSSDPRNEHEKSIW